MKFFSKCIIILIIPFLGFSQSNLLNAKKPEDLTKTISVKDTDNFLDYDDVDEKDILWSKVVYEFIDVDQKLNFPLLYPTNDDIDYVERKSLWRVLKEIIRNKLDYKGAENDSITGKSISDSLEIFSSDRFTKKLNQKDIYDKIWWNTFSKKEGRNIEGNIKSEDVGGYNIKGVWYFDKKHSELRYRLLGIEPVTATTADKKAQVDNPNLNNNSGLWIWYPSIRKELDKYLVFNDKNNNSKISFDELLTNRRFDSYIYKYDNVYGNRSIKDYITRKPGESDERLYMRRLLESERIKKEILDFEIDMWGY